MNKEEMIEQMLNVWNHHVPFNNLLGFVVTKMEEEHSEVQFTWDSKLMGNPMQKILHGGVTAAVLDMAGGVVAAANMISRMHKPTREAVIEKISKLGTINLRTDYLRPGKGTTFIATARIIRHGSKIAVTQMELHNEEGEHIAFGTATYMV